MTTNMCVSVYEYSTTSVSSNVPLALEEMKRYRRNLYNLEERALGSSHSLIALLG